MTATWAQLAAGLLDLIYPPRCLVCERWDAPLLCDTCRLGFVPVPEPSCVACGHPVEPGIVCRHCREAADRWGGWAFDRARAVGLHQGTLRQAIHVLKYRDGEALGLPLGTLLAEGCGFERGEHDFVVALPLTTAKRHQRGYNQAALLAAPVAEHFNLPLLPVGAFQRTAARRVQMTLSGAARRHNTSEGDFTVTVPEVVAGKRLLLIDDVRTTGTTLHTAAAALRRAGAVAVDVATLSLG